MGSGRSSGAGIVLCFTIIGFIVSLFIFWPLAFAVLFIGLAIFCALESSSKSTPPRIPEGRRPRRYEPSTRPERHPPEPPFPSYRRETYPKPESSSRSPYRIRVSDEDEETRTGRPYLWKSEEEEDEVLTSIPELREENQYEITGGEESLDELEKELEDTRAKFKPVTPKVEPVEKTVKEPPVVDEKAERLKDLESEEEATKILLDELKTRWMSGKIDLNMYQKLKEKYQKKIEEIEKKKKEL